RMQELIGRLEATPDPEVDRELTRLQMSIEFSRPQLGARFADELSASGFEIDPRVSQALLRQRARWLRRPDVRDALRALDAPVLVVRGDADLRPGEPAEELASLLPRGRLVRVPEAGHFSWLERPEIVRSALRDWVGAIRSRL